MTVIQAAEAERDDESLIRAFRSQGRVIGALILREVRTRFGKHHLGYLWALVEPSMQIIMWLGLLSLMRAPKMNGLSTIAFLSIGIYPIFLFTHVDKFIRGAIGANKALLQYPLVKPVDLMISRLILESATVTLVFMLIIGGLIAIGKVPLPYDLFSLFPVASAILTLAFGFGVFNAITLILWPTWDKFLSPLGKIIYLTSGVFFNVDKLPAWLKAWIGLNPLTHGVAMFRTAYFPSYRSNFGSLWYMYACGLTLLLIGLSLERFFRKAIQDDLD